MTLEEWLSSDEAESIRFDLECDCKPESEIEQILKDKYNVFYREETDSAKPLAKQEGGSLEGQCRCCWCREEFPYSDYNEKEYYYFHAVCLKCGRNCLFKKV